MSPIDYRGHTIDADTNTDGAWIALVDGDERGRPQRSRDEALREARTSVNRSLGQTEPRSTTGEHQVLVDDDFWRAMREAVRA